MNISSSMLAVRSHVGLAILWCKRLSISFKINAYDDKHPIASVL